jgi:hypothetical protein
VTRSICSVTLLVFCFLVPDLYGQKHEAPLTNSDATGSDLVSICAADFKSNQFASCVAFIHGVIGDFGMGASAQLGVDGRSHPAVDLCAPDGARNGQIVKAVLAYADKHPEHLHYSVRRAECPEPVQSQV